MRPALAAFPLLGQKTFIFVGEIMGLHDVVPEKRVKGGF